MLCRVIIFTLRRVHPLCGGSIKSRRSCVCVSLMTVPAGNSLGDALAANTDVCLFSQGPHGEGKTETTFEMALKVAER